MNRKLKLLLQRIGYSRFSDIIYRLGGGKLWADWNAYLSKRKLLASAKKKFEETDAVGNFEDYKQALEKHWVSYTEYAEKYEF